MSTKSRNRPTSAAGYFGINMSSYAALNEIFCNQKLTEVPFQFNQRLDYIFTDYCKSTLDYPYTVFCVEIEV